MAQRRRTGRWGDWGVLAGVVIVTGLGFLDLLTPVNLLGALVIGTFATAAVSTPGATAVVACYAIAWAVWLGAPEHWSMGNSVRIGVNLTGGALAYCIARVRVRREEALRRVIRVAEVAQQAVLRPLPRAVGEADIAVRYVSAAEEALIGGDLYEAVETPHGVRVVVGDVRGKGLDGVRLAAVVLGAFREAAFDEPALVDVARAVDDSVARHLGDEDFVTAVLLELRENEVRIINLGHPSPLRYLRGVVEWLDPELRSTPLGLTPDARVRSFTLAGDERILLYTDGVVECRDDSGEFFNLEAGARATLGYPDLGRALDALVERLRGHCGEALPDDVALVLIARRPAST